MLADSDVAKSAVVEHPHNSMITTVLQHTAHLRPTDGLHHSLGISVAPPLSHQRPAFPPGLGPATPAVTTPTKKHDKKDRPGDTRLKEAIKNKKEKLLRECPLSELDQREKELDRQEAIQVGKLKLGVSQPTEEAFDELMAYTHSRRQLQEKKERARLEEAGGQVMDRLAQRQMERASFG